MSATKTDKDRWIKDSNKDELIEDIITEVMERVVTNCPICKNDSTFNINDVKGLIPMFKQALNKALSKSKEQIIEQKK